MPLSYHQKSGCYSYIIQNTSDINKIQNLSIEFLKSQLNLLKKARKNRVNDLIETLNISDILNSEKFSRVNGMVENEYSLVQIQSMLKKSKIFQNIFSKNNLSEYERDILVGTLIRIKSRSNPNYGKEILIEFFKTLDNYNEEITLTKLGNLKNLYPIKIKEIEKELGIKCEYCEKYNITNTMELINGVEFIDFNETKALINWVVKAERDYLINNDEVPLEFIYNELNKIDVQRIEEEIEKIKRGERREEIKFYKYTRLEEDKYRILYSYSAEDRVISTTIMFLIDNVLGGEYTSSYGYSYKLNRDKYKNYKIFESWNYLWMNYKKDIEDKIYDSSYDDYYLLKLDLKNFYDSINHIFLRDYLYNRPTKNIQTILNNMKLKQREEYKNLCEFLIQLCETTNPKQGVPQGPAFARYLAEIYINQIDLAIKNEIDKYTEFYFRYVDDMIILIENKEKAEKLLKKIINKLRILDLDINSKKHIFEKVRSIKYEIINDDIEKYFIDGIEEDTPQFIKSKAKIILQNMFEKIKNDKYGEVDCKNVPFFLTHLIDEKYIENNKEDIIECVTNTKIGRGSMYKHFYNNIIFNKNVESLDFYKKIDGLSRSNFINSLVLNSSKVEKDKLQEIYDNYIIMEDLEEYEKIELYILAIQNELALKEKYVDIKLLLNCIKYSKELRLDKNVLHNVLVEVQKNDNKEERLTILEEILCKSKKLEEIDDFVNTIESTIDQINSDKRIKIKSVQILYNLVAFSTLYLSNIPKIKQMWNVLLNQYSKQALKENEWYQYREIMAQHEYNDSTIISFLTSELSGENIIENEEISHIELMYIASLIIYISKIDITNKSQIFNDQELRKAIENIAEQKNMIILKWCINGNTEYFPNKDIALLNSQYNERIIMIHDRTNLLVRGKKYIFVDGEIQKEECNIDGEERYFKIYNIDTSLTDVYSELKNKEFFEALKIIDNIFSKIFKDTELVNVFEKGSINNTLDIKFRYSTYDNVFVVDENTVIEKNIEEISRIIAEKILNKNMLKPFKCEYGRTIKSEDICKEFVPSILKSYYDRIRFLIELSKKIEEIPINMKFNDYEIEKAKILTISNSKIDVLRNQDDYSSNYRIIRIYNTFINTETSKILYGKVEIKESSLFDIIDTLKKSISKNIDNDTIKDILNQFNKDLKFIEDELNIESDKIQKISFEHSEGNEESSVFINKDKYNVNEIKVIIFGKKEGSFELSEKQILILESRKYIYFAEKTVIILPEFLEKILEIINNKKNTLDFDNILNDAQIENSPNYTGAVNNIALQNYISENDANKKLKIFLNKYNPIYYEAIMALISKYKIISQEDINNFICELKGYLDNNNYIVCCLKNHITDRNGLGCILQLYEDDFGRNEKYDKKLKLNLEETKGSKHNKIVIVSDIGISGSQLKKRLDECKLDLKVYEEVIFLNCIYTDTYKKNLKEELKTLNIKFKGNEISSDQYMYNKLKKKYRKILKNFFLEEKNKKFMDEKMPHDKRSTYRKYIENIENDETTNLLVGRFKSMPKAHHIIFDNTIFKYRKDK